MSRLGEKKDALKLIGAFRPNRGSTLSVGHAEGVAGRQLQHLQDTRSKRLAHRQLRRRTSHQITRHGTDRPRLRRGHRIPKQSFYKHTKEQQVFSSHHSNPQRLFQHDGKSHEGTGLWWWRWQCSRLSAVRFPMKDVLSELTLLVTHVGFVHFAKDMRREMN